MQSGMHPEFNYTVVDEADLLRQPLLRQQQQPVQFLVWHRLPK